jgi:hypothetical protein
MGRSYGVDEEIPNMGCEKWQQRRRTREWGDGIVGEWRGGIIRNSRELGRGRLTRNFGDRRE